MDSDADGSGMPPGDATPSSGDATPANEARSTDFQEAVFSPGMRLTSLELNYPDGDVVIAMAERLDALELKLQFVLEARDTAMQQDEQAAHRGTAKTDLSNGMDFVTVARNAAGKPDLSMEVIDHDMAARKVAANKDLSKVLEHGIAANDVAAEMDL